MLALFPTIEIGATPFLEGFMGFGFFGGCSRGKHTLRRLIEGASHLIKDRLVVACGVGLPASVVLEVRGSGSSGYLSQAASRNQH
jgi:hypothetical protein